MMPATMKSNAMTARTTADAVRPEELPDPVEGLTCPPLLITHLAAGACGAALCSAVRESVAANLPLTSGAARPKEVVDDIFTEMFRRSSEDTTAVPSCNIVHEGTQPVVIGQHEDVQCGMPPGH